MQAVREQEGQTLALVGSVSGQELRAQEEHAPAFGGAQQPVPVFPLSRAAQPPPLRPTADPALCELLRGGQAHACARQVLLSGWLAARHAQGCACSPELARWLLDLLANPACDPPLAAAAAAALLAACAASSAAAAAAATAATPLCRPFHRPPPAAPRPTPPGEAPLAGAPGVQDFLKALQGLGLRDSCPQAVPHPTGGGDEHMAGSSEGEDELPPGFTHSSGLLTDAAGVPPAFVGPMPWGVPLLLSLVAPSLAARGDSPEAPHAAALLAALCRVAMDPMGDLCRSEVNCAADAVLSSLSFADWPTAAHLASSHIAHMGPSPRAVARALARMPLNSLRGQTLRASTALAAMRTMAALASAPAACHASAAQLGADAPPSASAVCAVRLLRGCALAPCAGTPLVDHAALCAALRLCHVAVEAGVAAQGEEQDGKEALLRPWRELLERVTRLVRPSALNLAAATTNGEASRLLARYSRREWEEESPAEELASQ